jgi:hypothetical protein
MTRRVSSEGEITPEGLRPRRYDEITRVALRSPRHVTIFMDADRVRLPTVAKCRGRRWCRTARASLCT